ncbi:membrane protein YqaA, SNARE-associated domain [Actinopolymorpha cephalotaxi]|uniref:Membrane protein YqaA with SNARE-associated domain n=1 Tax=Actinopolymorpha cephalotaxi TaxID=504797 RepID=A0A1I2XHP7_9ACTN|nr:VTT domain-containing protein [Actinopolymorpha cephalotaxi]NYH86267.1 membrane protein YqaA with SNARE-associated domain [Actinopolymorpha cephalotaxi]SFH13028.1 membrane protein YqaA, SNARE-associated domain [Actinopolymorpha cephalotaxi]
MGLLAATFCYCIASALIPLINAEAYVGAVAATFTGQSIWLVAAAAAGGQMVGKVAYFMIGRNSLRWSWVRKKTESPKWQQTFLTWQRRIGGRPWLAGVLLLVSAALGFPPFAVVSVVAGQLRVPITLFVVVGFVGRLLRFASLLGIIKALL